MFCNRICYTVLYTLNFLCTFAWLNTRRNQNLSGHKVCVLYLKVDIL